MDAEPITPLIIMMKEIRVIIRLCSPLPEAPRKFESRIAITRLDAALKKRVKKVDMMFLNIVHGIQGHIINVMKLLCNDVLTEMINRILMQALPVIFRVIVEHPDQSVQ
jgi:hypothetical protein